MSLPENWPAIEVKSPRSEEDGVVVSPPVRQTRHVTESDVASPKQLTSPRHSKPVEAILSALHNLSDKLHKHPHESEPVTVVESVSAPEPVSEPESFKVRYLVRVHVNCGINWHVHGQEHSTKIGVCQSNELVNQLAKVIDRLNENSIAVEKINEWLSSDKPNIEIGPLFDGVKDVHNCVVKLIRVVV